MGEIGRKGTVFDREPLIFHERKGRENGTDTGSGTGATRYESHVSGDIAGERGTGGGRDEAGVVCAGDGGCAGAGEVVFDHGKSDGGAAGGGYFGAVAGVKL